MCFSLIYIHDESQDAIPDTTAMSIIINVSIIYQDKHLMVMDLCRFDIKHIAINSIHKNIQRVIVYVVCRKCYGQVQGTES